MERERRRARWTKARVGGTNFAPGGGRRVGGGRKIKPSLKRGVVVFCRGKRTVPVGVLGLDLRALDLAELDPGGRLLRGHGECL